MDSTHEELQKSNGQRLTKLAQQGMAVQGLREGYMIRLLEYLVGDDLARVKVSHELWVAEQLDNAEGAITRARLGLPTTPITPN